MPGQIRHDPAAVAPISRDTYDDDSYHLIGGVADKQILLTTDVSSTPGDNLLPVSQAWAKTHYENLAAHGATATPTASRIPIADGSGKLDSWITAAELEILDGAYGDEWVADLTHGPSRHQTHVVVEGVKSDLTTHAALTNPHSATITPTPNRIPIANVSGNLNDWVTVEYGDEILLTPKPASTGPEGTIFYGSDDDHVWVATEA